MNSRFLVPSAVALVLAAVWACKVQAPPAALETDTPPASGPKASASKKGPKIACDQPEFDVGTVAQGETMSHVFTIKNVGDDVMNILSARGG